MDDLFNLGLALSIAAAPPVARDAAMDRMLASFRKQRAFMLRHQPEADDSLSAEQVADDMLRDFDANQASWINGGCK